MFLRPFYLLFLLTAFSPGCLGSGSLNLPEMSDASSGVISLEQERELGQSFLRALRAQADTVSDPLLKDYLEHQIYRLVVHSQVKDRRLDIVIINSPALNAFAVPGGVIGVNLGLFLNAETEHEFSAILAHELAHLSQRHFARQFGAARQANAKSLAGLLAGILLMATTGADAGMAAMALGQSAAQNEMLEHSRNREAEADRIGIDTLADAGMDPRAMAYMFERLNRLNRLQGANIPEFLRTHPVTQSRIADSYNQAHRFPVKQFATSLDYQLMRARVIVNHETSATEAEKRMRAGLQTLDPLKKTAAQYGLALALMQQQIFIEAGQLIRSLRAQWPQKIAFILLEADFLTFQRKHQAAVGLLAEQVQTNPGNFPLTMAYASVLEKAGQPVMAQALLAKIINQRPNDADIWYEYAEVLGLSEDIPGVHQARAEYFLLVGHLDQSIKQLEYALPLVENSFQLSAKIRQRIIEIHAMRDEQRQNP
ncbi:MAG: M48 family metalloprotease [Gammaproteobacteria bacterium]|nr:M48 family metalloprotease [Gammaproteobacteria bacterium]